MSAGSAKETKPKKSKGKAPSETERYFLKAKKKVPNIVNYETHFKNAIKGGKKNLRKDNPFIRLAGEYPFATTGSTSEDKAIQKEMDKKKLRLIELVDSLIQAVGKEIPFTIPPGYPAIVLIDPKKKTQSDPKKIGRWLNRDSDLKKYGPRDSQREFTNEEHKRVESLKRQIDDHIKTWPKRGKESGRIVISTDPVDILMKSTGQSWSSCEALGSGFSNGIWSDIRNNNAIAYLYKGGRDKPSGRYMLRWCEDDKNKQADVGIEKNCYPHSLPERAQFLNALADIISQAGYQRYDKCTTPYEYKGYSDTIGGGGRIPYLPATEGGYLAAARDKHLTRNFARILLKMPDMRLRREIARNKAIRTQNKYADNVTRYILSNEDDINTLLNLFQYQRGNIWPMPGEEEENAAEGLAVYTDEIKCQQLDRIMKVDERGDGDFPTGTLKYELVDKLNNIPEECDCVVYGEIADPNKTSNRDARAAVYNRELPERCACDLLKQGVNDEEKRVRQAVASAPKPKECNCEVNLQLLEKKVSSIAIPLSRAHIEPECACEVFERMSERLDWKGGNEIGYNIARNPSLPGECACNVATKLIKKYKHDSSVMAAILDNKTILDQDCGCDIIKEMASTDDNAIMEKISAGYIPDECACEIYTEMAKSNNRHNLIRLAQNENVPKECAYDVMSTMIKKAGEIGSQGLLDSIRDKPLSQYKIDASDRNFRHTGGEKCEILRQIRLAKPDGMASIAGGDGYPDDCACWLYESTLRDSYKNKNLAARANLADNSQLPTECRTKILQRLSRDSDDSVKRSLLDNTYLLSNEDGQGCRIFNKLSREGSVRIQEHIAATEIPEDCRCSIYRRALHDPNGQRKKKTNVYLNMSHNPVEIPDKCACEIYRKLSDSVKNPDRPWHQYLGNKEYPDRCRCEILEKLLDIGQRNLDAQIAGRDDWADCGCRLWDKLGETNDAETKRGLARNTNYPEKCGCDMWNRFANDATTIGVLGDNQHIPHKCRCEVFRRLGIKKSSTTTKRRVATNPSIPSECVCEIFEEGLLTKRSNNLRQDIARAQTLQNVGEECGCDIFKRVAKSRDEDQRRNVVANEYLPEKCRVEILEILAADDVGDIREAARQRLQMPTQDCDCENDTCRIMTSVEEDAETDDQDYVIYGAGDWDDADYDGPEYPDYDDFEYTD